MSPEQALGKRVVVDGRTDIYSLGVTLYELLTLRPALDGHDRAEVLRKIAEEEPAPPRKINPAVPRDLETVLLKAMAKEPAGRYATARDLAEELRRFLEHKPIAARRPSPLDQVAKWARRHRPLVVSAAAGTVTSLTLAVIVLAAGNLRIQEERRRADEERRRAEANLLRASQVVDRLFTRVAQDLANTPHMEKLRRALLVDALKFYGEFLKENGSNRTLKSETARVLIKVGDIHHILGQYGQAEGSWRRAIVLLEELSAQFPRAAEYRDDLAYCFGELGVGVSRRGRTEEGIEYHRRKLALRERIVADFADVSDYRLKLALAHTDMGNALWSSDRVQEAEHHYRRSLMDWEKLRSDYPDFPEPLQAMSHIYQWWANLLLNTNRLPEAEPEFRRVLAIRQKLAADEPGNSAFRASVASTQAHLGRVLLGRRKLVEAEEQFRRSVHIYEALVEDFPDTPEFLRLLALGYVDLSDSLNAMCRFREAEVVLRRALSAREKLSTDALHGGVSPTDDAGMGWAYYNLGLLILSQRDGRAQEAADAFRRARDRFEKDAADNPQFTGALRSLAHVLATCPDRQFRDPDRAVDLARRAVRLAPRRSECWSVLGEAEYQVSHWAGAIEAWREWIKRGPPDNPALGFHMATAHWRLGHEEEARLWYDRAAGWMDEEGTRDEELRRIRDETAEMLKTEG
jgi:tetratricopeptide (TPR) repeat protein